MRHILVFLVALMLGCPPAFADEPPPGSQGARAEVWLGVSSFPGLGDIRPLAVADGFDTTGFGFGGAWHVPVKRFENSDLLIGVDGFIAATESSISGYIGDLAARHLFLGTSVKWALGKRRNVYLDAGVGYHELDMAELSDYIYGIEHVAWKDSAGGAFVGATWDVGAGREHETGGFSLGLKVHFVDFGNVYDENTFIVRILGDDAGKLSGPIYMLQLGYGSR